MRRDMKLTVLFVLLQFLVGYAFAIGVLFLAPAWQTSSLGLSIIYSMLSIFAAMLVGVGFVGYFHLRSKGILNKLGMAILLSAGGLFLFLLLAYLVKSFLPQQFDFLFFLFPLTGSIFGFNLVATTQPKDYRNNSNLEKEKNSETQLSAVNEGEQQSSWTGKDFEFLIAGEIDIAPEDYERVLTPNSFEWRKIERENCTYYHIDNDEYSCSLEEPGIQLSFNEEIPFKKARQIANEVVDNIKATGQYAELVVLKKSTVYRFE